MDIRQYSINIIREVGKIGQGGLPTLIEIRPDQHKIALGKPDGFLLCMADGVPVRVLSSVTSGKIKFTRRNKTDVAEMTYTADPNPPYGWRQ